MRIELKKAIVLWLFDNLKEFQLHNACTQKFREYIFDGEGNFLIGGPDVSEFIGAQIKLLTER